MAISVRHKHRRDNFDNGLLDQWPTGTLHRLLTMVLWAKKVYADVKRDDMNYARIHWMEQAGCGSMQDIADELNHQLTARAALRQVNRKQAEVWVTPFHSAIMDAMNVEAVSNDPEVRQAFPESIKATFGLPVVCWKYSTPLGIVLSNEKSVVLQAHKQCDRACDCHRMPDIFKDASGHVATTDLRIVEHIALRKRMQAGTTFRGTYETVESLDDESEKPDEMQALLQSIESYCRRSCESNEVPRYVFGEWAGLLEEKLQKRYDEVAATARQEAAAARVEEEDYEEYLKQFRKRYAIITGDKAKNTYCILCKPHLSRQIMDETQGSTTYTQSQHTEAEITAADFGFVKGEGLVTVTVEEAENLQNQADEPVPPRHTLFHKRVPTFGVSLKMHKNNSLRFMAKSHATSLTQLSSWMSSAFKLTTLVSENIWRNLFQTVGIATHGSWVINSSKQVRMRMRQMEEAQLRPSGGQQTYDFSTMYTSMKLGNEPDICHDGVKQNMNRYVDLVFEYQKQSTGGRKERGKEKVLMLKHKGLGGWRTRDDASQKDTNNLKYVSAERLKQWLEYLLKRLFVKVGNQVQQQVVGLPMGTSCSPFLANLVLFMFEFEYFTEQISSIREWSSTSSTEALDPTRRHTIQQLRRLAQCTRYIDDLWNPLVDREQFQEIVKHMYPTWLQLGLEHEGESVNYLDMTIWHTLGTPVRWHSKLYDKKVAMIEKGLKLNKFPDPASKLSTRCKYGVITSQLHRYTVACTRQPDFVPAAVQLYKTYVEKGYQVQMIDRYFERFIRSHLYGKLAPTTIKQQYRRLVAPRNQ